MMNSISQYLKELETQIIALGGNKGLVEEYSSHLEAEFDDFMASQTIPFEDTKHSEEIFVHQLESPMLIAQSLLGVKEEREKIAENISQFIIISSQTINRIYGYFWNKYEILSRFYSENRTPPLTALIYFLAVMIPLYLYTQIRNLLFDTPPVDYREGMIVLLFIFVIIASIGWRYPFRVAVQSAFFFSIFLTIVLVILGQGVRIEILKSRLLENSLSLTQDWYQIPLPSINSQILKYIQWTLVLRFFPIFFPSIPCLLVGALLKHIYIHQRRLFSVDKKIIPLFKSFLFILCIVLAQAIPAIQLKEIIPTRQKPIPIPTPDDCSLIYSFELEPRSDDRILLEEFGNISLLGFGEEYNVTVIEPVEDDVLLLKGRLTLLRADVGWEIDERIRGTGSQFDMPLLGILFLPKSYDDHSWPNIVGQEINTSYPFKGYNATIDTERTSIPWRINKNETEIAVNTIKYQSLANNSVFTFFFEKTTGWLLKAELNGPWVPDTSIDTLNIERLFLYEPIDEITPYLINDSIMILVTLFVAGILVGISSVIYYIISRKKY
ncbi:MAG: hypothetical protein ACFFDT_01915 [Candidatus Hodarchaeota archaeon]